MGYNGDFPFFFLLSSRSLFLNKILPYIHISIVLMMSPLEAPQISHIQKERLGFCHPRQICSSPTSSILVLTLPPTLVLIVEAGEAALIPTLPLRGHHQPHHHQSYGPFSNPFSALHPSRPTVTHLDCTLSPPDCTWSRVQCLHTSQSATYNRVMHNS